MSTRPVPVTARRRNHIWRAPGAGQARAAWLFLAPSLVALAIFVAYPMLRSLYLSFTDFNLLRAPEWVGLENFERILTDGKAMNAVVNTLVYAAVTTVISVLLALVVAVVLNRPFLIRGFARTAVFLPFIVSLGVISIAWSFLLNPDIGLLAYWSKGLGISAGQGWLRDPNLAMAAVILVGIWKNLGFYVVMYLAGLQSVPREIYEAANVDGAGPLRRFFSITWPLLANQTMLIAIIATINNVQVFDQIYVMTQGGPYFKTETLVVLIYRTGFGQLDFGYASALSWVLLAILLVLSMLQFGYFRRRAVTY